MKTSVGLFLSLGLSLSLTVVGCGGKSSKKTATPPTTPGLTTKPEVKPTPGTGTGTDTPVPVKPEPSTPVTNTPVVTTPTTPTHNGTGTGPVGPGTGTTQPTTPTQVVSTLRGVWGVALTQKPRTCSTIYDIRGEKSLAVYILCPNEAGKSIAVQSDTFTLVSDDGVNAVYQSGSSSCAAQSRTLRFNYKVSTRDQSKFLVLDEGRHPSPELQSIPESNLAGDLGTATSLYGRPVIRGCFVGGSLVRFEARRILR